VQWPWFCWAGLKTYDLIAGERQLHLGEGLSGVVIKGSCAVTVVLLGRAQDLQPRRR
jgi:hypothetical protein